MLGEQQLQKEEFELQKQVCESRQSDDTRDYILEVNHFMPKDGAKIVRN